jgi:carbamate kinase
LALEVRAETLLVLTDVEGVAMDFGKPTQRFLRHVTLGELEDHLVREPFSAGSMGPKVRAAYRFVRDGGRRAVVCALDDALAGLRGDAGTVVGAG